MGLFGFLGKVLKGGLSVATHGASDKIINGARAIIGGKPKAANMVPYAGTSTAQERALLNKLEPPKARVRITEHAEGWSFKSKPAFKRKRRARAVASAPVQRAVRPAKPRTGRKPPPGGLDLKAMAAAWRSAGKPGTWANWIKTNQLRRA